MAEWFLPLRRGQWIDRKPPTTDHLRQVPFFLEPRRRQSSKVLKFRMYAEVRRERYRTASRVPRTHERPVDARIFVLGAKCFSRGGLRRACALVAPRGRPTAMGCISGRGCLEPCPPYRT